MTRRNRIIVITGVSLLLLCLIFGGVGFALRGKIIVETQRDRWEALGIDHYEIALVGNDALDGLRCEQRIEVAKSNIKLVTKGEECLFWRWNDMHNGYITVDYLFERVDDYGGGRQHVCIWGLCLPHTALTVQYDANYHYPSALHFRPVGPKGIPTYFTFCSTLLPPSDVEVIDFKGLP